MLNNQNDQGSGTKKRYTIEDAILAANLGFDSRKY